MVPPQRVHDDEAYQEIYLVVFPRTDFVVVDFDFVVVLDPVGMVWILINPKDYFFQV